MQKDLDKKILDYNSIANQNDQVRATNSSFT